MFLPLCTNTITAAAAWWSGLLDLSLVNGQYFLVHIVSCATSPPPYQFCHIRRNLTFQKMAHLPKDAKLHAAKALLKSAKSVEELDDIAARNPRKQRSVWTKGMACCARPGFCVQGHEEGGRLWEVLQFLQNDKNTFGGTSGQHWGEDCKGASDETANICSDSATGTTKHSCTVIDSDKLYSYSPIFRSPCNTLPQEAHIDPRKRLFVFIPPQIVGLCQRYAPPFGRN